MSWVWRHKLKKSRGVKMIHAESEKRGASEEWEELWVGHRHCGEQSGAKWGWTSQQQPVPPYYPQAPPPVPSPPPQPPTTAAANTPVLCGGHATSRTTMTPSLPLHWWMARGRDRGGGGALFMLRVLQSVCIFYRREHNMGIQMWERFLLHWIWEIQIKKSTNNSNTGHCGGFDLRWVTVLVMGAKRAGERSEKWSIFGSTAALLMLRRCS